MRFKPIILVAIVCLLVLGESFPIHARLFGNSSPIAFDESEDGSAGEAVTLSCSYSIRELVIISGSHYLKGQSYISDLSEKVELSDIQKVDFWALREDVNNSINKIYDAWYYYQQLESKADSTPYNDAVIKKLADFDYDSFLEKNGLIADVFKEVKAYLIKGDVRGVYSKISGDIAEIYFILRDVQLYLYWGIIPNNETMWNLNQQSAKTLLFGQYVARVFETIK